MTSSRYSAMMPVRYRYFSTWRFRQDFNRRAQSMLEAVNLECTRGDRRLFKNLNFSIKPGELIELRGANGTGKTSLLRILSGLSSPAHGEVRWNGKNIRSLGEEFSG